MSSESFLPPFSSDRTRLSRVRRKRRGEKSRDRSRIALEPLEPRTLLSTLPPVTVQSTPILNTAPGTATTDTNNISDSSQNPNGNSSYNTASESSPSVVIDQANPQKMVAVWTTSDPTHSTIPVGDTQRPLQADVQGAYSTDGGLSWTNFTVRGGLNDDPTTGSTTSPIRRFNYVTDASISFNPNDQSFYVTYIQQNAPSGGSAGELDLRRFDFSTSTPQGQTPNVLYQWAPNTDIGGIYTPTVAVDGNVPSFTDTDTNGNAYTQTDPYSGNVYVAWVEQDARSNGTKNNVVMIGSSDQGATFTNPTYVNTDFSNINANTDNYHPQIAISQGTPTIPGGQVSIVWDANTRNANSDTIAVRSTVVGPVNDVLNLKYSDNGGFIGDAADAGGGNSIPAVTTFSIDVPDNPNFTITDLNLGLTLKNPQNSNLNQFKIVLIAPDGTKHTLVENGLGSDNKASSNPGYSTLSGSGIGGTSSNGISYPGLIFDDQAPRGLNTAGGTGYWEPPTDNNGQFSAFGFANGKTLSASPAGLGGTWQLEITDYVHTSGTPLQQSVTNWSLQFSQGLTFSNQVSAGSTGFRGNDTTGGSTGTPADFNGIAPSPSITIDNTLGAYSPYQGYMYVAYVYHDPSGTNPNPDAIRLARSTDGGQTWVNQGAINDDDANTDGFSGGNKLYLMPSLAVDPTTGTLVASWYDGRYDPAHARLAMMVAASNDGGSSFSANQFVNTAMTAQDGITNQTLTRGPLLDNQAAPAGNDATFTYGYHQGLAVYGGQVVPVWAGNLDGNLNGAQTLDILTSQVRVTGGPRVLFGTMGPIGQLGDNTNSGRVTVGNPNAAVGTPKLEQILVTFDRPVAFDLNAAADNPNAFDKNDVHVYYQQNTYDASGNVTGTQFIPVPVGSIVPAGIDSQGQATQFYIKLAQAQTAVGVYVYTITPSLKSWIRTYNYATQSTSVPATVGVSMDQNADGSGGTGTSGNAFAIPAPNNLANLNSNLTTFPGGPYSQDTVPIIIPGPYITSSHVDSGTSNQLNNTVSAVTVTFDRFVDPSTFTPDLILRVMGPNGDITASAGPFTITPLDLNGDNNGGASVFRINFANPVQYSGTYTVQIGSGVKTKPIGTAPAYGMDTNLNAGLDIFRGGAAPSTSKPRP